MKSNWNLHVDGLICITGLTQVLHKSHPQPPNDTPFFCLVCLLIVCSFFVMRPDYCNKTRIVMPHDTFVCLFVCCDKRTNQAVFRWEKSCREAGKATYQDRHSTFNNSVRDAIRRGAAENEVQKHEQRLRQISTLRQQYRRWCTGDDIEDYTHKQRYEASYQSRKCQRKGFPKCVA